MIRIKTPLKLVATEFYEYQRFAIEKKYIQSVDEIAKFIGESRTLLLSCKNLSRTPEKAELLITAASEKNQYFFLIQQISTRHLILHNQINLKQI